MLVKKTVKGFLFFFFLLCLALVIKMTPYLLGTTFYEAQPQAGFHWGYYLYLPPDLEKKMAQGEKGVVLVLPNNTGHTSDDWKEHAKWARRHHALGALLFSGLDVALLTPVFPRPSSQWKVYTHALDRDTFLLDDPDLSRLDLQLLAMLEDLRKREKERSFVFQEKSLFFGFSAAGMFVGRFTLLHPDAVLAASIGSPGGWPIAPKTHVDGVPLRYPIGLSDLEELAGKALDLDAYRQVPQLLFLGEKDHNDSVPYRDGYEEDDAQVIETLFGMDLQERFQAAQALYEEECLQATFLLSEGVGHRPSLEALLQTRDLFRKAIEESVQ